MEGLRRGPSREALVLREAPLFQEESRQREDWLDSIRESWNPILMLQETFLPQEEMEGMEELEERVARAERESWEWPELQELLV